MPASRCQLISLVARSVLLGLCCSVHVARSMLLSLCCSAHVAQSVLLSLLLSEIGFLDPGVAAQFVGRAGEDDTPCLQHVGMV